MAERRIVADTLVIKSLTVVKISESSVQDGTLITHNVFLRYRKNVMESCSIIQQWERIETTEGVRFRIYFSGKILFCYLIENHPNPIIK